MDKPTLKQVLNTLGYGSNLVMVDDSGNGKIYFNGYYDYPAQDKYLKPYENDIVETITVQRECRLLLWTRKEV